MKIIKYIKNIILSIAITFFQIFSPQKQLKLIKSSDSPEENDDISDEDKALFIANAIEYTPATKFILHEYYKLFNEKYEDFYVIGVVGQKVPLKNIHRSNFCSDYNYYKERIIVKRAK